MHTSVNLSSFRDAFMYHNRQNNFSWEGLEALFNYLEELENDTDEQLELDVIALCCDFSEYEDTNEFLKDYPQFQNSYDEMLEEAEGDEDEAQEELRNLIGEHTTLIAIPGYFGFIIQQF